MEIRVSRKARKQLITCPGYIQTKFKYWKDLISYVGQRKVRMYKGFHDEPLKGDRWGQRSVRLSKAYRIIYREVGDSDLEIIEVLEVNKHDY